MNSKSLSSFSSGCFSDPLRSFGDCLGGVCETCSVAFCSKYMVRVKMRKYLYLLNKSKSIINYQLSFPISGSAEQKGGQ